MKKKYTAKHLKNQLKKRMKQYSSTDFIAIHKNMCKKEFIRIFTCKFKETK